ncbi:MAG: DnaB-like helicase C-terminal domain-containing protein [Nitrososphaerota archaeon]
MSRIVQDLDPDVFSDENVRKTLRLASQFYKENKSAPDVMVFQVLKSWKQKNVLSEDQYESMSAFVDRIYSIPLHNRTYLLGQYEEFLRHKKLKNTIYECIEHVKNNDVSSAEEELRKFLASTYLLRTSTNIGREYPGDLDSRIDRRMHEDDNRIWTLMPEIDRCVSGLGPGEIGVWLSQRSSAGKSAALVQLARNCVLQGKRCLIYTLELGEEAYEDRLDMCIGGLLKHDLVNRQLVQQKLLNVAKHGNGIFIKKFPMALTRVSDLRAHKRYIESVYNFYADLVIIDYADLLAPETGSLMGDLYASGLQVYQHLSGWATEEEFPIWTASQSNRSAMESTVADQEHTGGSIAKAQIADVIISINRTSEEVRRGQSRLHIVKNRTGQARFTITINTDFSRMQFYVINSAQ